MDEEGLFVWRAGVVSRKEPGACCVYVYVFGCVCPTETHVRLICMREARPQARGNNFCDWLCSEPVWFITEGVLLSSV